MASMVLSPVRGFRSSRFHYPRNGQITEYNNKAGFRILKTRLFLAKSATIRLLAKRPSFLKRIAISQSQHSRRNSSNAMSAHARQSTTRSYFVYFQVTEVYWNEVEALWIPTPEDV